MRQMAVTVSTVILLVSLLTSCTSTSTSTPAFTQTTTEPTTTELVTEPEPSTTGDIQGTLISAETQESLAGAAIILGQVTGESECTLQSDLIASAGEDGTFQLAGVPPGIYVVFYDPSGDGKEGWVEIDKLKILYGLIGKRPRGSSSYITDELYDTLADGGEIIAHYGAGVKISIRDGLIESIVGSHAFTSGKYGLTIQFTDGEPIRLEVKAGETTNVRITVMVTVLPSDSSDS